MIKSRITRPAYVISGNHHNEIHSSNITRDRYDNLLSLLGNGYKTNLRNDTIAKQNALYSAVN